MYVICSDWNVKSKGSQIFQWIHAKELMLMYAINFVRTEVYRVLVWIHARDAL